MKVWSLAPFFAVLMSSYLMAAERVEHQVTVTAQIPTENFFVKPISGDNWTNNIQKLGYNSNTKKLEKLTKQLEARSSIGTITGYLPSKPTMTSGANSIELNVSVGGLPLGPQSVEIINADDASKGKIVDFSVTAADAPPGGYKPGDYKGVISMVFESEAPKGPETTQ
ncbi:CS1 type fimbrial major subunit [Aeromonas salmonicida]|uniref:CS1 type fimbrial major subunit n=1 Tax=Aeromonas salmonicida TaxID=645 RepID=UPI002240BB8B|nr:CS1 type fimbrial major subunit [Aeromonas salmonicida]